MMTSTKDSSPFAIRLEILKMARELVVEEFYTARDMAQNNWEAAERKYALAYPEFPGNDKIIDRARDLYTFISTKA